MYAIKGLYATKGYPCCRISDSLVLLVTQSRHMTFGTYDLLLPCGQSAPVRLLWYLGIKELMTFQRSCLDDALTMAGRHRRKHFCASASNKQPCVDAENAHPLKAT
jgi:hypothetical protein